MASPKPKNPPPTLEPTDEELAEQAEQAAALARASDPISLSEPKSIPVKRTRGLLAAAMNRTSSESFGSAKLMPKRRVTFIVDAESCNPGVFLEDFELTLESLSAKNELEAARKAKGDPTSLSMWFAFYGLSEVNGDRIDDGEAQREWLWEALGPARQVVIGMYAKGCMMGAEAQGKALGSLRVE